mmetsp:Transcript_5413/g.10288  ORF Transcript_5413/g.10288 Transcript_5413/m.10288 type:complete len:85 (+) Transcript_5413:2574-2828(+)
MDGGEPPRRVVRGHVASPHVHRDVQHPRRVKSGVAAIAAGTIGVTVACAAVPTLLKKRITYFWKSKVSRETIKKEAKRKEKGKG